MVFRATVAMPNGISLTAPFYISAVGLMAPIAILQPPAVWTRLIPNIVRPLIESNSKLAADTKTPMAALLIWVVAVDVMSARDLSVPIAAANAWAATFCVVANF